MFGRKDALSYATNIEMGRFGTSKVRNSSKWEWLAVPVPDQPICFRGEVVRNA
jgi:hypothetical protein